MHKFCWFPLGVLVALAFIAVNTIHVWKRGKPLVGSNVAGFVSLCLVCLGITFAVGASWKVLVNFTLPAVVVAGVWLLLIRPRLFGRQERDGPTDEGAGGSG